MSGIRCLVLALLVGFGPAVAAAAESPASAEGAFTIEACHEKARANYPLARQYAFIDAARGMDLAIAKRGYLPRLNLSGKASYQSDVTSLDSLASSLPPAMASALSSVGAAKDQYQALAEITQTIWDGGAIKAQLRSIGSSSRVERGKLDVDLYAVYDRVDQLFFGILAFREQLKQNDLLLDDLDSSYRRVEASLRNGIASPYDLDAVRVEVFNAKQKRTELSAAEKSEREMLAAMLGESLPEGTVFAMPDASAPLPSEDRRLRPEFGLFEAQKALCDSQEIAVRAANMPRLSAFFQTAYAEPGLNMFKSGFAGYWLGGLKLSWSLNGLLDLKDQLGKIGASRREIEAQEDAFALNNGVQAIRDRNDIEKLRELLRGDDEIIALRLSMRASTEGKLENGVATTDDVLKAIDAESLARQAKSLHEVQLAMAAYALKNTLGR